MSRSSELKSIMANCYGTENYYRYLNFTKFLYTDGVKTFCEHAQACWFLDLVFASVNEIKTDDWLLSVKLNVKDEKGVLTFKDGNGTIVKSVDIDYTDCPEGEWLFYYYVEDHILIWNDEY